MDYVDINWMDFSLCRGQSHLFFPPGNVTGKKRAKLTKQALAICEKCPVSEPCREYAIITQSVGVWGGQTDEQRSSRSLPVTIDVARRVSRQQEKESAIS